MKILKYALFALGGLVILLGAVLAYVAATFDPNDYKPRIVQRVKEKQGRTLGLDGDIKLSFWPNLGADIGRASLSEFRSEQEFASVERARVSLALLPLLRREAVVDTVTVKGLRANLVRYKDGRMNIDDLVATDDKKGEAVKFDIAGVALEDAAITFRDEQKGARYALTRLDLRTGRIAPGVPSAVELSFQLQSTEPKTTIRQQLKGRLGFNPLTQVVSFEDLTMETRGDAAGYSNLHFKAAGALRAALKTGEFSAEKLIATASGASGKDNLELRLEAPRLSLTAEKASGEKVSVTAKLSGPQRTVSAVMSLPGVEGTAQAFKSGAMTLDLDVKQGAQSVKAKLASSLSGNVPARQLSLPALHASVSASGPDLPGKSVSAELKGSASVDMARQGVQAQVAGKVADSNVKARIGVAGFAVPSVQFDIDIDQLDVDRYFPPKAAAAGPAGGASGAKGAEQPFDLSALRNLRAAGALRIGTLKAANVKASNVRLEIKAAGGRLDVNPMSAALYQGTMSGALGVHAAPATPTFTVRQTLSGVSVGPLLRDLAGNDTLEGRGNVNVNVSAQGNTVAALKKALNGNAAVKLTDGAVKGINVAQSIRDAKATLGTLRGQQVQQADKAQRTDFSELTASFDIKNGVARNTDLSMKSPLLRVGGAGDINLGEDTINYLVKASIVGTTRGQGGRERDDLTGLTVPVRVAGALGSPSYTLDFGAMVTDVVKQRVEETVRSRLEERLLGGAAAKPGAKEAAKEPPKGDPVRDVLRGLFGR
jgi:AsmA protein